MADLADKTLRNRTDPRLHCLMRYGINSWFIRDYSRRLFLSALLFFTLQSLAQTNYENNWEQGQENVRTQKQPTTQKSQGQQGKKGPSQQGQPTAREEGEDEERQPSEVRKFHEVLDELLAEFGYDVRMGQIRDLKNVAVRKVTVSEALPKSYPNYIELLVAERIRENSKVRIISCLPCKGRTSRLIEGRLMITSPLTNMEQLARAADQLGIDYFMDVVLIYHTTHMVLAFQVFNTETKEMVWTRTYNSETIKSRFQKLAVDYSQVEKSRPGEDYLPEYRILFGLGGALIPNVVKTDNTGMIDLSLRGTEKFDNRLSEFGMLFSIYQSTSSILSSYPSTGSDSSTSTSTTTSDELTPTAFTTAINLSALYQRNFFGELEIYDRVRHGVNGSIGILLATGYLAPIVRVGWDIFLGKKFVMSLGVIYVTQSKILVGDEFEKTPGGTGGELLFSVSF